MVALRRLFASRGMLKGTTASYMAGTTVEGPHEDPTPLASGVAADEDGAPVEGVPEETLSIVTLSATTGACTTMYPPICVLTTLNDRKHVPTGHP